MARDTLDWLVDDEGNIRSDAARAVAEAQPPAAPRRPVTPRRAQHGGAGLPPELRHAAMWVSAGLVAVRMIGCWQVGHHPAAAVAPSTPTGVADLSPPAQPSPSLSGGVDGSIVGENVIVRAAPDRHSAEMTRLVGGDRVVVGETSGSWCAITTATGEQGWVFGAYVRGAAGPWLGPAVMTRRVVVMTADGAGVLRPGDKVLVLTQSATTAMIGLYDGGYADVPAHAVALLH